MFLRSIVRKNNMKLIYFDISYRVALYSSALVYVKHGNPNEVLQKKTYDVPAVGPDDVHIQMIASPVNPSDINMIQGVYPIERELPAIGGSEGVGEIVRVGSNISIFKPGDKVFTWGKWQCERGHGVQTLYVNYQACCQFLQIYQLWMRQQCQLTHLLHIGC